MASLLEHKLIVVTGKGGTGKTTAACALGLIAARRGLRTIVAELGDQHRLPTLFGQPHTLKSGVELALEQDLWSTSIDPDEALIEWLRTLGGHISVRLLAASSTFHYFAAAAPGAKELVSMIKVRDLCEGQHRPKDRGVYDLVVLDAPATGHALAMLRSPQTFATIVRVGPLAEQAQQVRELLEDPHRTAFLGLTQGTEMAVTETLELEEGLRRHLDRDLETVVVNGTVPRRFTREELLRVATATGDTARSELGENAALAHSAGHMARVVYERARVQQSQVARLRRQRFAEGKSPSVVTVPFVFTHDLDLTTVRKIALELERKL
jgi:anion-transporting  ArsA/GET3 family ATPase